MRFTCTLVAMVFCVLQTGLASPGDVNQTSEAVTVTGCLERDDTAYRLTATSGRQAPKSRSWKTGFLKKRTADLDVVEASQTLGLQNHVGHRDALTGRVMRNGELHVTSMRHLSSSCGW